jgi:hypothetical protein
MQHLDTVKVFLFPNWRTVNCLKNNFTIYIKIDIKTAVTCFGVVTASSGGAIFVLAKARVLLLTQYSAFIHTAAQHAQVYQLPVPQNVTEFQEKMVKNPITGLDRSRGFHKVEPPRFQDNRHMKVVRLSALRTGRLYPQKILLVLIYVRGWVNTRGHSATGRIMAMKISNDTTGNWARNLPAFSAVPQPTALPRAPNSKKTPRKRQDCHPTFQ